MERKEKGKAQKPQEPLKRLLLCDVDGTLLIDGSVREEDARWLQRWKEAGNGFGLVTGRGEAFCRELCRELGVEPDVLITDNGAEVWMENRCLHREWLPAAQVARALEALRSDGLWPSVCVPFVTMPDGAHRFARRSMGETAMVRVMETQAHLRHFSDEDLEDLLERVPDVPGVSLYVWKDRDTSQVLTKARRQAPNLLWHQTSHDYVEACASDKARALHVLLASLTGDAAVSYVGDGPNDIPVFDVLADTWCMDTAPAFVKARAANVTSGVDRVIERKLDHVEKA